MRGKPKLVMIMKDSKDYFITKEATFYSVADIVEYYKKNNFGPSLPTLDRRLRDPIKSKQKNRLIKKLNISRLESKLSTLKELLERRKTKLDRLEFNFERVKKTLARTDRLKQLIADHVDDSKYEKLKESASDENPIEIDDTKFIEETLQKMNSKYNLKIEEFKKNEQAFLTRIKECQTQYEKINIHVSTVEELLEYVSGTKRLKGLNDHYDQIKMCLEDDKKKDNKKL
ncbi:hypothetical protein RF11_13718 [Thelohanellus kitauei]|uniref:Uncharacterized protein n=1 Tax=Thelohanellus kitauei TaxID=669202 RepID=A0A0C2IAM4_THEKT|nr:hypothetical protein RF11_13718 [Thelohanellus kitauei]